MFRSRRATKSRELLDKLDSIDKEYCFTIPSNHEAETVEGVRLKACRSARNTGTFTTRQLKLRSGARFEAGFQPLGHHVKAPC